MKIYNTLTRKKDEFTPIIPGEVSMYACGQTTYNYIHIGNARFYVIFDMVRRYLEYKGYKVKYVQNFTDVDDKIIKLSIENGVPTNEIVDKYIAAAIEDIESLGCGQATINPRATEEMPEIIDMIKILIQKGYAYEDNGSVYYETAKSKGYGKLSRKNTDDLEAGARVEINENKRSPMDFVLWKPDKPGEPKWDSPWGTGRPGWHIECSAMVKKYLGSTIDIHCGGDDLIFPHHENEIAQSEAANDAPLARYWMHNGQINVEGKKMAKSTGNFTTYRDLATRFPPDVIRFYLLSGHYRMPMEYGEEVLLAAANGLSRIKNAWSSLTYIMENTDSKVMGKDEEDAIEHAKVYKKSFEAAMDDDFNTADAVAAIFELTRYINSKISVNKPGDTSYGFANGLRDNLIFICELMGLNIEEKQQADPEIESLIAKRQEARKNKDWTTADAIRGELLSLGVVLEDTADGVRWSRKGF